MCSIISAVCSKQFGVDMEYHNFTEWEIFILHFSRGVI